MERLWAIRQNIDPFSARILLFNYNPLAIIRCTIMRCPYCRWIFKVTWGLSSSLLGSGERGCWHCNEIFWDGSNEWPEMSDEDRRLFVLPISVAGYLGGFLVICTVCIGAVSYHRLSVTPYSFVVLAAFSLPLVLWAVFRCAQVSRSIRRYNARGEKGRA
jgi:hypothetical protein